MFLSCTHLYSFCFSYFILSRTDTPTYSLGPPTGMVNVFGPEARTGHAKRGLSRHRVSGARSARCNILGENVGTTSERMLWSPPTVATQILGRNLTPGGGSESRSRIDCPPPPPGGGWWCRPGRHDTPPREGGDSPDHVTSPPGARRRPPPAGGVTPGPMCGLRNPPGARGRMYPDGWVYTSNWGMCTQNVHKCAPECAQMCAQVGQKVTPKHPPGAREDPPSRGGDPGPMCGLRTPMGQGEDPPAGGVDPGPMCGLSPPGARRRPPQQGGDPGPMCGLRTPLGQGEDPPQQGG